MLYIGVSVLMFPGCSDDVDDPIDDRGIYSREIPEQEIFTPNPVSRCANDTETSMYSDTDSDTCPEVAPGF